MPMYIKNEIGLICYCRVLKFSYKRVFLIPNMEGLKISRAFFKKLKHFLLILTKSEFSEDDLTSINFNNITYNTRTNFSKCYHIYFYLILTTEVGRAFIHFFISQMKTLRHGGCTRVIANTSLWGSLTSPYVIISVSYLCWELSHM